ncbi:MAG TPA: beta-N-acetylhexosaminidase [Dongiaceae bacterium]|nr:beta-N-acetylhexosaminidase [Dongiaceae bacterium]
MAPLAAIFGCAGTQLAEAERRFFARVDPAGFILFARNVADPAQLRELTGALRQAVGRDVPILVDQEGGRVQRLKPPYWRAAPPPGRFGDLAAHDPAGAALAVRLNARLIGAELSAVGIDTVCAPSLDLRLAGAHQVIGDRAFSADPAIVAALGRTACEGFFEAGITPVIKHLPGHGRSQVDSHLHLPAVDAPLAELAASDFRPFRELADMPLGMTGHLLIRAVDAERPATISSRVIAEVIRGHIGFKAVLISDDLSMEALAGSVQARAAAAIAAGCDIALHCNGKLAEMEVIAEAVPALAPQTVARLAAARPPVSEQPVDAAEALRQLDQLLAGMP